MNPREEWHLPTRRLGRRVLLFDCVDSTSTRAAALAEDPANDGLVVVADEQTAGRGRQGRTWQCPAGEGILLSALLFPPAQLRRPALLTAWAAVAVCDTVQEVAGLDPCIKWPNDVLVSNRKVCGILIEQGQATIAGIGLNVNQSADDFAALPHAGSLRSLVGHPLDRRAITKRLIHALDDWYERLNVGDAATLEQAWRERLGLAGRVVNVEIANRTFLARLRALGFARIELELPDGATQKLLPEQVLHLQAAPADSKST